MKATKAIALTTALVTSLAAAGCNSPSKGYLHIAPNNSMSIKAYDPDGLESAEIINQDGDVQHDLSDAIIGPHQIGFETILEGKNIPFVPSPNEKYSLRITDRKRKQTRIPATNNQTFNKYIQRANSGRR